MSITDQELYKLSELAKIYIDQDPKSLIEQLNNTLLLVEELKNAKLNEVDPLIHLGELTCQPLREDLVTEAGSRTLMQSLVNSENIASGLYLVPKVIDN